MERKQILKKLEAIAQKNYNFNPQNKNEWIIKSWNELKFDELDHIIIVDAVESKFNIVIPDLIWKSFRSYKDVFEYLKELLIEKPIIIEEYVPKTYVISDTHLSHSNLVRKVSSWEDCSPCRDFENSEEMNDLIIKNINDMVGEDDILYHLGDFAITNPRNWGHLRQRIKCKNIHLILGNHDPYKELLENKCYHIKEGEELVYGLKAFFIGDLFASIQYVKNIKVQIPGTNEHQDIFLSHYSHRTWEQAHRGRWHLYGHSHGSLAEYQVVHRVEAAMTPVYAKCHDMCLDQNNFKPYSMEKLMEIMKDRVNLGVDHHKPE